MSAENPSRRGFDFTAALRDACQRMTRESPHLQHIDLSRVAISWGRSRKPGRYGLWASLTPLRFLHGAREAIHHHRRVVCQQIRDADGKEMLYLLTFYVPRFMDLSFLEKVNTIFHELWHISPQFDGDLRRFPGRCYAHTESEREYDSAIQHMAEQWLQTTASVDHLAVLQRSFAELQAEFGAVYGSRYSRPKLIPIDGS